MTKYPKPATIPLEKGFMHLWYRDKEKLAALLVPFQGGQCQLYAGRAKEIYRGQIRFVYASLDRNMVRIQFAWYSRRRINKHEFDPTLENWQLVPPFRQMEPPVIDFDYVWYYHQKSSNRVKLQGWRESCRLYLPTDPTNIKKPEDE